MPITKSAHKAVRGSLRKKAFNVVRKEAIKNSIKGYHSLISSGGDANEALTKAYKALDKAAKRGLIKKGNAARRKSRLARLLVTK